MGSKLKRTKRLPGLLENGQLRGSLLLLRPLVLHEMLPEVGRGFFAASFEADQVEIGLDGRSDLCMVELFGSAQDAFILRNPKAHIALAGCLREFQRSYDLAQVGQDIRRDTVVVE